MTGVQTCALPIFSEPNLPHAWPHEYPIDFDIVGIATYGQYVAVLTTSFPYLFQGIDPAAMSSSKVNLPQACVSKRSIIETGNGVIYASPDGLVEIVELPSHPWFVATQFHPEFKSTPRDGHPLFTGFVRAARKRRESRAARP